MAVALIATYLVGDFLSRNKLALYCVGGVLALLAMAGVHIMEDPYDMGFGD